MDPWALGVYAADPGGLRWACMMCRIGGRDGWGRCDAALGRAEAERWGLEGAVTWERVPRPGFPAQQALTCQPVFADPTPLQGRSVAELMLWPQASRDPQCSVTAARVLAPRPSLSPPLDRLHTQM